VKGERALFSRRTLGGVAAASFILGLAASSLLPKPSEVESEPLTAVEPEKATGAYRGPGPRTVVDGIPSGFSRDRDGAVAAAVHYVSTGQALLDMDPLAAEEAVRSMASADSADLLADDTLAKLHATRDALRGGTGPVVFRQAVVAHRLESFTRQRARVAVWRVGVLAREGIAPPQADWAVSTFDLVWEGDDWRIWGQSIVPGPAPILNDSTAPATAEELVAVLEGFSDYRGAA
jgi:hypothetical protein